ncbi:calcium-activated chloride channel regulator 4-like [Ruditapes philippinarum]|uniref:calcium-activated chloride channel regulator 4-like n=1 Tax=Ruditapes philippinarum TaxID=129788 RepID=UPI00295AA7CA|nr:calcium-activated chloride channel regulator 4-like [Ruditapes philippinarum]
MRDHIDFQSEPLPAVTDTTPVFNIVRETDGYRVFVLDVSGSMSTNERSKKLYQASKYVIQKRIPDNSWLGIIWFNDAADVKMNLTHVVSQKVRDYLVAALPQRATGGTCIGCGIEKALQIFRFVTTDLRGCEIIVISDGKDGNTANFDSAMEHVINEKCVIHTISISQAADERMISMATRTGGIHISYLETETINFASVFMGVVSKGVTQAAMESTTLISETVDTLGPSPYTFTFDVDNSVGKNTTVSVLNKVSGSININVESPNGTLYSQQANGDSLVLCIPGIAEPGRYNATIEAESTFEHIVTSEPTGPEVVRVDSWISPVNFDFVSGNLPVVGADVSKGRSAVLNANVTAIIGTGVSVPLFDNGLDPDDLANDGAYAGVIPRYCIQNNGRLTAKVIAHAEGGTASIKDSFGISAGYQYSDEDLEEPEVLKDSFQRVSLHNEILVSNFSPVIAKTDITPPGRITDVDVIDITTEKTNYGESRNFTITWTATGNDVNIGQAANYELRIADDIYTLINNFSAATMLDTVNTNYTPKAAGETEYIRIEIDAEESYTSTTFFALRAKDEAGNLGDVSNIVSILVANGYRIQAEGDVEKPNRTNKVFQFNTEEEHVEGKLEEEEEEEEEEPVEGKLEEEEEEEEGGEEEEKEEEKTTKLNMLGIGLSCAAVVIVIVIIVVAVIRDKKRKQNFEITRSPEVRYSEQLQV